MKTITIEIPDDLALPDSPSDGDLARELMSAAAIKWYREGRISQGKGAEIAGLSRAEFLDALFSRKGAGLPGNLRGSDGGWIGAHEVDR
jgi:hypothetical protein